MPVFCVTFVMMLQVLHKILAVIIALTVLLSTMSFTVEKHVCMGEVTEVAFFDEVEGCGMEESLCETPQNDVEQVSRSQCCDDIQQLIPGNDNEQQPLQGLEIAKLKYIVTYLYTFVKDLEDGKQELVIQDISPPLVDKDIQVLYQTFLI